MTAGSPLHAKCSLFAPVTAPAQTILQGQNWLVPTPVDTVSSVSPTQAATTLFFGSVMPCGIFKSLKQSEMRPSSGKTLCLGRKPEKTPFPPLEGCEVGTDSIAYRLPASSKGTRR